MNDYISLRIDATPCSTDITDLLAAFLADIGYESFEPDSRGITAFVKAEDFDETAVDDMLSDFPMPTETTVSHTFIEGKDWNEEWEKNYFKPIVVAGRCVVHSTFHKDLPEAEYDIVIDPKMAFGTGHHSTTCLMAGYLLDADLTGKSVIDMGTGTGILAILAAMKGAGKVWGIEIDPGAYANAIENASLNNVDINLICGDASALTGIPSDADIFIANINRNIILADIERYSASTASGGTMLLSGFYQQDIPLIERAAACYGLKTAEVRTDNDWACIRMIKD